MLLVLGFHPSSSKQVTTVHTEVLQVHTFNGRFLHSFFSTNRVTVRVTVRVKENDEGKVGVRWGGEVRVKDSKYTYTFGKSAV